MEFEWDNTKNEINIAKHGIDFSFAVTIFRRRRLEIPDARKDYGEVRTKAYGITDSGLEICIIYTVRDGIIRIISARKVNKNERKRYYQN